MVDIASFCTIKDQEQEIPPDSYFSKDAELLLYCCTGWSAEKARVIFINKMFY